MRDQRNLRALRAKARRLYLRATNFDDMDCGRRLAEHIRPDIAAARIEFDLIWSRVRQLDPTAPPSPFAELGEKL